MTEAEAEVRRANRALRAINARLLRARRLQQVVQLRAEGLKQVEIAESLGVSLRTVRRLYRAAAIPAHAQRVGSRRWARAVKGTS